MSAIKNYGFSLLEMTMVMIIISVLAGLALISYRGTIESAKDQKRIADILTVKNALLQYRLVNNAYPAGVSYCQTGETLIAGGYLNSIPRDPKSSSCLDPQNSYSYVACSDNKQFILRATLGDKNSAFLNDVQDLDTIPANWNCPAFDCLDTNAYYCVSE